MTEVTPTVVTVQGAMAGAYLDKELYPVFLSSGVRN
ncbi:TPA: hypothetical protein JZE62_004401 [Escherichia coli]|nr:hypothetical protein [Escherichia coli]